jgi:hypothetical protein
MWRVINSCRSPTALSPKTGGLSKSPRAGAVSFGGAVYNFNNGPPALSVRQLASDRQAAL